MSVEADLVRNLASFAAAASILTITPGVDTALVLRNTTAGWKPAAAAGAGVISGCLTWGIAVAAGVSMLVAASPRLSAALNLAGGLYLIVLGVRLIVQPRRTFTSAGDAKKADQRAAFRAGFATNILNPKVGLFYLTFLPQFLVPQIPAGPQILLLVGVHAALSIAWFAVLILMAQRLRSWLRQPPVITAIDRVTGSILAAVGLRIWLLVLAHS